MGAQIFNFLSSGFGEVAGGAAAFFMVFMIVYFAIIGFVFLGHWVNVAALIYIYTIYERVPEEHRWLKPEYIFLLFIPLIPIVGNFFVYPKISESMKAYFNEQNVNKDEDCGNSLGVAFSVLGILLYVPGVNVLVAIPAVVLWAMYIYKLHTLKEDLPEKKKLSKA